MKRILLGLTLVLPVGIVLGMIGGDAFGVRWRTILQTDLKGVEGKEALVTLFEIPQGDRGPRHYHPADTIVYVLEGSGIFRLEGKPDIPLRQGHAYYLPPNQVHHSETPNEALKLLVFRVHPKGQSTIIYVTE